MTTMKLNASLLREVSTIISDEDMVKNVISYIRRLRRNRTKEVAQEETISKEEILAGIDAGLKDVLAGRTRPARELLNEL